MFGASTAGLVGIGSGSGTVGLNFLRVETGISISGNEQLESVEGMPCLQEVGGIIEIAENANLTSIEQVWNRRN